MPVPTSPSRAWVNVICMVCIIACGIAVYSNTARVPFLFDDVARIAEDESIRTLWPPSIAMANSNRPFAQYTFAVNYALHGFDVFGYHLTNLLVHLVAALALFGFARNALRNCEQRYSAHAELLAFSIAIVWIAHPLNTQAVTYIVQRLESLMGLAYLATLFMFSQSQYSRYSRSWLLGSILVCAFGMGCKEVMFTAPLLVLCYDRAFVAKSWRVLVSIRGYYYLFLATTWGVLAWSMLHYRADYANGSLWQVEGLTSWTYLISQSSVLIHYLSLAFWPQGQCVYLAVPVAQSISEVLPQLVCISAMIAATVLAIARFPRWGFLGICFFLILSPTSSVIPIQDLSFEHRMYLPLAAVIASVLLAFFDLLCVLRIRTEDALRVYIAIAMLLSIVLGLVAFERNRVYVSEVSVWEDTLIKSPNNVKVRVGLAGVYAKQGLFAEARKHFLLAIETAPADAKVNASYAGLLIEMGELESAGTYLERAFQANASDPDAITNMGHLQSHLGNFAEAAKYYELAVQSFPNDQVLQSSLIAAQIYAGRLTEAEQFSQANLARRPNSARAHVDYASALAAVGSPEKAMEHCAAAIALNDQFALAHATLSSLEPDSDKAIQSMAKAIAIEPDSFDFNRAMGELLIQSRPLEAAKCFELALKSEPDNVEVLLKAGLAWDAGGKPAKGIPHLERVTHLMPEWADARKSLEALRKNSKP